MNTNIISQVSTFALPLATSTGDSLQLFFTSFSQCVLAVDSLLCIRPSKG